jgi:predicted phosphodiesterase
MRVLVAGDVHGNSQHADYLNHSAVRAGASVILQVGDFGYWEHWADGIQFLDSLNKSAATAGVTWVFIDGNHDKTSLLLEQYSSRDADGMLVVRDNIRYAQRGHRWSWAGTRFIALGGAYSVDKSSRLEDEAELRQKADKRESYRRAAGRPPKPPRDYVGHLWFPEEEMSDEDLAGFLTDTSAVDVLVAHDKPRASHPPIELKTDPACSANQDRIQAAAKILQPQLLLHGHLHVRYTDWIRVGDGEAWTRVEGLAADPKAAQDKRTYQRTDSWLVLDLPLGLRAD